MIRCTYLVYLQNNENNIDRLICSLKDINSNGRFRKEFIIIDDGSKDRTLALVKAAVNDLPRTTIITQETEGPALSINKGLNLATGEYIHFVEGEDIIHPDATLAMLDACMKFGVKVACCKTKTVASVNNGTLNYSSTAVQYDSEIIDNPIREILTGDNDAITNIGGSGSFVASDLLSEVNYSDNSIYSQKMSLSLRCAKNSRFVFLNDPLTFTVQAAQDKNDKFDLYNRLKAIYNFAQENPEFSKEILIELVVALARTLKHSSFKYYLRFLQAKYTKTLELETVLNFYQAECDKLF